VDYATAGRRQVLDKASRFMRAHLALVVAEHKPMGASLCMQLVEETLELDEWIHSIAFPAAAAARDEATGAGTGGRAPTTGGGNSTTSSGHNSYATGSSAVVPIKYTPLTVCSVLYDAKEVFHTWLLNERDFFRSELLRKFSEVKNTYCFDFGIDRFMDEQGGGGGIKDTRAQEGSGIDGFAMSKKRCYRGVYQCVSYFSAACERYRHVPPAAQYLFSLCVLEPLLVTALAFLLYRIRSSDVLYKVSLGTYKKRGGGERSSSATHSRSASAGGLESGSTDASKMAEALLEVPELMEFMDSVQYFQLCLSNDSSTATATATAASSTVNVPGHASASAAASSSSSPAANAIENQSTSASYRRQLLAQRGELFRSAKWTLLQDWIPKVLITDHELRSGFTLTKLVEKAWELPADVAQHRKGDGEEYIYRRSGNMPLSGTATGSAKKSTGGGSSTTGSSKRWQILSSSSRNSTAAEATIGELGECIDMTRALAITLAKVLRTQFQACN
jgi:hypothetical protein